MTLLEKGAHVNAENFLGENPYMGLLRKATQRWSWCC